MKRPNRPLSAPEAVPYFDEARRMNAAWHEKPSEKAFIGVAKPVRVFDEAASYEPQWRLRTQTSERRDPISVAYLALPAGDGGAEKAARDRTGAAHVPSEHDRELRISVAALIDEYRIWPDATDRGQILHLLHRLQVYARGVNLNIREGGTRDADAATRPTMSATTFRSYIAFFDDLRQRIEKADNTPPGAEEAAEDLQTLKAITRYFRDLSLALPDITDKLATKPRTYLGASPQLRIRLQQLMERGLQKLTRDTPAQELRQFLCAFSLASRALCRDDRIGQSNDLNALLNKTVPRLRALQNAERAPLFDLFEHLVQRVLDHEDHSLVPTLEALLLNEDFNLYVERLGPTKADALNGTLKTLIRDVRPSLWQAGTEVLARRPPSEFCDIVEDLVATGDLGPIDDLPLNYLFARLNDALGAVRQSASVTAQAERYNGFLERLADANGLHVLTVANATPEEKTLVLRNLHALYNVDIQDMSRLATFFSNAVFRAGKFLAFDGRPLAFDGRAILRDVEAMLQKATSHPVNEVALFEKQMNVVARDYARGLSALRGLVLRSLGERLTPGWDPAQDDVPARPRSVEAWLRDTVLPTYDGMMRVLLRCYPLVWHPEDFGSAHSYANKVIMAPSGGMFVAGHEKGRATLLDILGRSPDKLEPQAGQTYHRACNLRTLLQAGDDLARQEDIQRAMGTLARGYSDFLILNLDDAKMRRMDALQADMLGRLRLNASETQALQEASQQSAAAFKQRIKMVGEFYGSVSSFGQVHLDTQAERRFFRDGNVTEYGRDFIQSDPRANATEEKDIRAAIADRMFDVGYRAVERMLATGTDAPSLSKAVGQIERLVEREIDILSFNTEATVKSFNRRHSAAADGRSEFQVEDKRVEGLRESLFKDSEGPLKQRNIDYIMPNQALATELCRHPKLENKNIFLKMGTGQGKSIVIATTAVHEADRLGKNEFVFVLTSYEHLACGDHDKGRAFFAERGIASACISEMSDVENLSPETKIIYADAKTLQVIAQRMIARQIKALVNPKTHPPSAKALAFLHQLYNGSHRFILDEYDLVLNDLDFGRGPVMDLGADIIDKKYVHAHRGYASALDNTNPVDVKRGKATDQIDGKGSDTINGAYIKTELGEKVYNLRPGGLRISRLLGKAHRIIGLSGSGAPNALRDVKGLEHLEAAYFELPSSRDPDTFGTLVVDTKEQLKGVPGIWRTRHQEILNGSESEYIEAIVSDVQKARELRDVAGAPGQQTRRPVLIFVDSEKPDLLDRLRKALVQAVGKDNVHQKLTEASLVGHLNEIGVDGNVTLTSLLCGRGADIFVSPSVPDGLHVVVATPLATTRLQTQVIGRTGRMGRDGTYATITLGKSILDEQKRFDFRDIENSLHDVTRRLVERLVEDGSKSSIKDHVLKWLLHASEIFWTHGRSPSIAEHSNEFA